MAMLEMMTTDLREQVAAIRSPVLLVAAAGMAAEPAQLARLRASYERQVARVPDARVVVAEGARHFVMLDAPVFLFRQMDRFLAGAAARGASAAGQR